jgi:ABC-type transport system involved in cytochrome bd biosynthesis fused ATPase/permease subunit
MEIKDLGPEIKQLTVTDIAVKTGKSERYVKTQLTKAGIACLDYDGEARRAAANLRLAEEENKTKAQTEKRERERQTHQTTAAAMAANQNESDSLFTSVCVMFGMLWLGLTVWGFSANGAGFFLIWLLMSFCFFMATMMTWSSLSDSAENKRLNKMSLIEKNNYISTKDAQRAQQNARLATYRANEMYGQPNSNLVCQHCHTKGSVRSKSAEEITTTKLMPIIGNNIKARKKVTQMHCDNCDTTWNV